MLSSNRLVLFGLSLSCLFLFYTALHYAVDGLACRARRRLDRQLARYLCAVLVSWLYEGQRIRRCCVGNLVAIFVSTKTLCVTNLHSTDGFLGTWLPCLSSTKKLFVTSEDSADVLLGTWLPSFRHWLTYTQLGWRTLWVDTASEGFQRVISVRAKLSYVNVAHNTYSFLILLDSLFSLFLLLCCS